MNYTLRKYQQDAADAAARAFMSGRKNGLIILPTGCHVKGSQILMADGQITNVELSILVIKSWAQMDIQELF